MATHPSPYLENSKNRGAWWATVQGVAESQTGLSRCSLDSQQRSERVTTGISERSR